MKLDESNTEMILEFIQNDSSKFDARLAASLFLKTTLSKVYNVSRFSFLDAGQLTESWKRLVHFFC